MRCGKLVQLSSLHDLDSTLMQVIVCRLTVFYNPVLFDTSMWVVTLGNILCFVEKLTKKIKVKIFPIKSQISNADTTVRTGASGIF